MEVDFQFDRKAITVRGQKDENKLDDLVKQSLASGSMAGSAQSFAERTALIDKLNAEAMAEKDQRAKRYLPMPRYTSDKMGVNIFTKIETKLDIYGHSDKRDKVIITEDDRVIDGFGRPRTPAPVVDADAGAGFDL
jgi:hypothetical protein